MMNITTPLPGLAFYLVIDSQYQVPLTIVEARSESEAMEFVHAIGPILEVPSQVSVKQVREALAGVPLFRLRYLEVLISRVMEDKQRSGAGAESH